jgi:ParB family transcriptional regulator, chromosome partitioning protein
MNRKSQIRDLLLKPEKPNLPSTPDTSNDSGHYERTRSGAVNTMADTLQRLSADAEAGRELREQINSGATVVELDPELVEPSFVTDRILLPGDDQTFRDLVNSIETHGQQVPVLVRPHPDIAGRYQIAYGHRRLRVAKLLGKKIRAVVRVMESKEVVIAQGTENSERRDLSFIERALFARNLETAGFSRDTIMAALSVGSPEVTRLLAVAGAIADRVVYAIGPAPKAGRLRWMALARMLEKQEYVPIIERLLEDPLYQKGDTDARFARLYNALSAKEASKRGGDIWCNPRGEPVVRIERIKTKTRLIIDERLAPQFGAFLTENLDALYATFTTPDRGEIA